MRVPTLHPSDERQVPDLRAVPVPPRITAVPTGRRMHADAALFEMRMDDSSIDTAPLVLADWSVRLAADFGAVGSALTWLATNTQRCIEEAAEAEFYAWNIQHDLCDALVDDVYGWRMGIAALMPDAELALVADAVKAGC